MSWDTLKAHWLTWDNIEERDLTWDTFEQLVDGNDHRGANDNIKIGAKTAMYRIKAFNASGTKSDFLTSGLLEIIPIFHREATLSWHVISGSRYLVLIEAKEIFRTAQKVPLTFRYNNDILALGNFMAHMVERQVNPGIYPAAHLQIKTSFPGEVRFRCIRPIRDGENWSGCVTLIELIAGRNGIARVSLS